MVRPEDRSQKKSDRSAPVTSARAYNGARGTEERSD